MILSMMKYSTVGSVKSRAKSFWFFFSFTLFLKTRAKTFRGCHETFNENSLSLVVKFNSDNSRADFKPLQFSKDIYLFFFFFSDNLLYSKNQLMLYCVSVESRFNSRNMFLVTWFALISLRGTILLCPRCIHIYEYKLYCMWISTGTGKLYNVQIHTMHLRLYLHLIYESCYSILFYSYNSGEQNVIDW